MCPLPWRHRVGISDELREKERRDDATDGVVHDAVAEVGGVDDSPLHFCLAQKLTIARRVPCAVPHFVVKLLHCFFSLEKDSDDVCVIVLVAGGVMERSIEVFIACDFVE